jgi:predicted DNA binding CopG/RHH family protein
MKKKNKQAVYVPLEPAGSTDHLDLSKAAKAPDMPRLKFSTESVTVRMPSSLVARLKVLANQRDVPYQSLMKVLLDQALNRELSGK